MLPTITVNGIEYASSVTAAGAPAEPPSEWYALPGGHTDAYDVVIEDSGRVHGYPAATWDACHLSFPNDCVTPPRSNTDYAYFKVGSVRTADGARVPTGPLTLKGGHADGSLSAAKAMAFYDDTRSAFADVAIGEDDFGLWVAGGLRPDASPEAIRAAMASGFSGDWRWIGDGYELIALSAVNTPGFRRKINMTEQAGMVASIILDMPRAGISAAGPMPGETPPANAAPAPGDPATHTAADCPMPDCPMRSAMAVAGLPGDTPMDAATCPMPDCPMSAAIDQAAVLVSAALRIASSIGRSPAQRIAVLRSRVHPEQMEVSA